MVRRTPVKTPAPKAKSLAQQETDFTAEGAPPPKKAAKRAARVAAPAAGHAYRGLARGAKDGDRNAAAGRTYMKSTR